MRRRLFDHCELVLFVTAWIAVLVGVWTDFQANDTRPPAGRAEVTEPASSTFPWLE
ncbi:hypothetical protein OAS39_09985 [Pirellulales bacterium]|nr:hypothetical protein [Pirellulales bacterium]